MVKNSGSLNTGLCGLFGLQNGGINAFMFSLPFITGLIVGKQAFDKKKNNA